MRKAPVVARSTLRWSLVGVLLLGLLLSVVWVARGQATSAAPPQPLPFSHRKHLEAGANCVYCHPGVLRSAVAGLPSVQKCVGCHQNVTPQDEKDQPNIDRLLTVWESGQPVRWTRVNDQPDYVYFSHQPHIRQGVACETCHGEVSRMDGVQPVLNLNMGFCLSCHRDMASDAQHEARLVDCATCHK